MFPNSSHALYQRLEIGFIAELFVFRIYTDKLTETIECHAAWFANYTEIGGWASCENTKILQRDIERFTEWARSWQMEYNVGKCKVIHFRENEKGNHNLKRKITKYGRTKESGYPTIY